jgi:N-acetylneuraminate synthase
MVGGIVAEVSNAHNGSKDRALRILDEIREAGADWVKFQCYTPAELVALRGNGPAPEPWGTNGWTMYDLYTKAQTPHAWFPDLVAYCDDIGLPWFSSVFGPDSLKLMEDLGCPTYKIASLDRSQHGFIDTVIGTRKPLIQSFPAYPDLFDVNRHDNFHNKWIYCPPGYPQTIHPRPLCDALDDWADGLSFHGTDWWIPAFAFQHKFCDIVEVHVQLDDEPSELEENVSLKMSDLAKLVEASR